VNAVLLLLLALQGDPKIESVERVAGDVNRPLQWAPLKVTLTSAAGYSGDVVVRSDFNFNVAKEVRLAPGGKATVMLASMDPKEVVAGATTFKLPDPKARVDRIVLVDERLPFASDLASTPQTLVQKISAEDLEATRSRGLLEAADLILLKESMGPGPGRVVATREEAEKAMAAIGDALPSLEGVDRAIWTGAPRDGWVPNKKNWTLYFATVYAFAAFVALAVLARRFPKFGLACLAGVAVLGMAGYGVVYPRSQVWVVAQSATVVETGGGLLDHRLWYVNSPREETTSLEFPRLVKPVFSSTAGSNNPFTIKLGERGCRVEGLSLGPAAPACFAGTEYPSAASEGMRALVDAVAVRGGKTKYLGDLAAGATPPATVDGEALLNRSPGFDVWGRFAGSDGVFGQLGRDELAARDLKSADLADERERPRVLIRRLR
jgi:hypothetical protein